MEKKLEKHTNISGMTDFHPASHTPHSSTGMFPKTVIPKIIKHPARYRNLFNVELKILYWQNVDVDR